MVYINHVRYSTTQMYPVYMSNSEHQVLGSTCCAYCQEYVWLMLFMLLYHFLLQMLLHGDHTELNWHEIVLFLQEQKKLDKRFWIIFDRMGEEIAQGGFMHDGDRMQIVKTERKMTEFIDKDSNKTISSVVRQLQRPAVGWLFSWVRFSPHPLPLFSCS